MIDSFSREQLLNLFDQAENETAAVDLHHQNDRYLDKLFIAEGSMKRVYRAYDSVVDRHIAYAELKSSHCEIKREAFLREAQLTAQLDHPNIISIYDISTSHAATPWFTMELKTGQTLAQQLQNSQQTQTILHSRPLRLEQFLKICDAIDYAHSKGIVHFDLKPENIQIGRHGEVVICDWGLGRMVSLDDHQDLIDADAEQLELYKDVTMTGKIKGTPGYMAPEQISGSQPKSYQTDIYALGAILYTMLCAAPPLSGDTKTMLDKTLQGDIVFPKQRFPELAIPESLNAVIRKSMSLNPCDRYQRVHQLQHELRQYLTGFSTQAENAGFLKELMFFYLRHRLICSISLISSLIVTLTVAIYQAHLNQTLTSLELAHERINHQVELIQKEKTNAQQALDMALQNKQWLNNLVLDNQDQLTKSVYDYCAIEIYKDPIHAMNRAVHELTLLRDANPSKPFYSTQLGYVYSIMQKFPEAKDAYQQHPLNKPDIFAPIAKMAHLYSGQRPLPLDGLMDYLNSMSNGHHPLYCVRVLSYDAALRNNRSEHAKLVHVVLKIWNPNWTEDQFNYQPELQKLSLAGKNLNQLTYHHRSSSDVRNWDLTVNIIGSLPIRELDLSQTDYYDFASLQHLNLETLDIRNTNIHRLLNIENFKSLRKLKLSKNQIPQNELTALPSQLEVEFF